MVIKNLAEVALAKKKITIKSQHLKDNLFVFVKCLIVNPSFDSQTKETLTTQVAKFGSKCELTDKFFDKLYKTGIVEKAISLTQFHEEKKLVKTDGKKVSKIIVPKLDDANLAGTKNSHECTLILTEGDSAKTMAISGLSIIGRDKYGVFPLRGKVMNVKDAATQKITDNAEITALKKIIGLEQNKNYEAEVHFAGENIPNIGKFDLAVLRLQLDLKVILLFLDGSQNLAMQSFPEVAAFFIVW
jgi:DNA topoisomerase-2